MNFLWIHVAIILFLVAGLIFAGVPLLASLLLAPKSKEKNLLLPYECGMCPYGSPWIRFGINYYFYALLFLAFDVDVLYLFPVASCYFSSKGFLPFIEIFIFVSILFAALIFFFKKGVFSWPKRIKI
ncbi:NADH-quinone oxidoreductase subunit A [Desulfonauticus submarinus]|uniref:NADH-quinone oxidoreductase subunit n=1 Tax=Desulfonauticus submarinus TaxID=206665 RepID=A0A1H0GG70_9BACT|nr:NADH-quinone oxidoreductase subunit A [Desulfonauticus submarinus]SDO05852.1 NADH-quinone oxidoreductase subunit A [Desulfonauticus submarinus]